MRKKLIYLNDPSKIWNVILMHARNGDRTHVVWDIAPLRVLSEYTSNYAFRQIRCDQRTTSTTVPVILQFLRATPHYKHLWNRLTAVGSASQRLVSVGHCCPLAGTFSDALELLVSGISTNLKHSKQKSAWVKGVIFQTTCDNEWQTEINWFVD